MLSILGKNQQTFSNIFPYFSWKTDFDVSDGGNLHEMSKPIFWKHKKNINLLSAELDQRAVKIY